MRPAHIRNTCILVCAVLSVAACSTTRRLGSDEVLYTGVKKILIEPDSGVVLPAAESAVKEPLSVAPNNRFTAPISAPAARRAVGLQLPLYAEGERIQILVLQAAGQTAVLISKVQPHCGRSRRAGLENYGYFGSRAALCSTASAAKGKVHTLGIAPAGTIRPSPIRRPSGACS
ncbi:MAG: hypothetical protein ACLRMJ_00085 [Alistipes finegoldii]